MIVDHARFWSILDEARASARRGPVSASLERALAKERPDAIAAFDGWFWAYYMATIREDLWAAIHAIRGGCSDDGFDAFRGWLVSRGEAAVLRAIRDPETLLELVGKSSARDERMIGAARRAYREVARADLPERPERADIPGLDGWPPDRVAPGAKWDAAFYSTTFPKLHAAFFAQHAAAPTGEIRHDRYWATIDAARSGAASAGEAVDALTANLCALDTPELIGFERWHAAYNQALIREDMRLASRVLLGSDEPVVVAGLRGWLMMQGDAAVRATMRDLDAIASVGSHPIAPCQAAIFVTSAAFERRGMHRGHASGDERDAIPDRSSWAPDLERTASAALRRARFPLLTAGRTDAEIGAPAPPPPPLDEKRVSAPVAPRVEVAALLEAGRRVRHVKFGEGIVVSSEDSGRGEPKLVIDFSEGRKTIAARFVEALD